MTKAILYGCPICKNLYSKRSSAEQCRDQPFDKCGLEIGEFLLIPGMARLYDAGPEWLAFTVPPNMKSLSHFDHHTAYHYWYVVLGWYHDSRDLHRPLVVVGSKTGGKEIHARWNPANGQHHYAMFRPGERLDGQLCGDYNWLEDPEYKGMLSRMKKAKVPAAVKNDPDIKKKIKWVAENNHNIPLL